MESNRKAGLTDYLPLIVITASVFTVTSLICIFIIKDISPVPVFIFLCRGTGDGNDLLCVSSCKKKTLGKKSFNDSNRFNNCFSCRHTWSSEFPDRRISLYDNGRYSGRTSSSFYNENRRDNIYRKVMVQLGVLDCCSS